MKWFATMPLQCVQPFDNDSKSCCTCYHCQKVVLLVCLVIVEWCSAGTCQKSLHTFVWQSPLLCWWYPATLLKQVLSPSIEPSMIWSLMLFCMLPFEQNLHIFTSSWRQDNHQTTHLLVQLIRELGNPVLQRNHSTLATVWKKTN